ncbi:MAG TPA: 2-oxo acid dehydrogenase subunit E2 [Clostridia bacterium]|nr:2-oxo acid dehydrogenase subunit E2 [Clostridia bacterium]
MEKTKRRLGDRKDGRLMRELDAMHFIMPQIYPNRCDNEAYISEKIDLTNINAYLAKKNETETEFPYTLFHMIVAAMLKTVALRPKMNRFIANKNVYERNYVSAAFVVKKQFKDDGAEALAFVYLDKGDTIEAIRKKIYDQITSCRSDKLDASSDSMEFFNKMPRFLAKFIIYLVTKLDKHGWCPKFLIATDPYYSTVLLTNLGSIRLKCGYHHLTNWGTNSVFVVIGEKKKTPCFDENGVVAMKETIDLGLTIDERLADGYYYSKTIRLMKHILNNPELLEQPFETEVPI